MTTLIPKYDQGATGAVNRVVNYPPVVGQPKAWSCTVAGTPGT